MEFVFGEVYALGVAAFKYLGDGLPGCAVDSYPTSAMVFKFWDRVHYATSRFSLRCSAISCQFTSAMKARAKSSVVL